MIYYDALPMIRTSCHMCDGCGGQHIPLIRLLGYYEGTNIKVSFLCRTDIQTYYWSEPMCYYCSISWTRKHRGTIENKITNATIKIQNIFRRYYYSPPTKRNPLGGKAYQKAKLSYEQKVVNNVK